MVILLLEFSSCIKADNQLERLNSEESFNHFDKVSYYLKQVLLNDEGMSKGFVEVLIVDLTLKRDIAGLLEKFHREPRIVMNVISEPLDISVRSLDFVIVLQDFLNSEFDQALFRLFKNDMNNLLSHNHIGKNEKFILINMLENSNDKSFMLNFNLGLASSLVSQKTIFNLLIIDVYDDGTEDLWRPQFISRDFKLLKLSLNVTTFARSKMGEIHVNIINLVQYDAPPFSFVENKKLIGVEGKLLDLFCERYNLTYRIVNENTKQYVYKDIIEKFYTLDADLSLTTNVQMQSRTKFVDFIDLRISD